MILKIKIGDINNKAMLQSISLLLRGNQKLNDLPGKSHYSYKTEVCIVWIFLKGRPLAGYNHTYNLLLGHFSVGTNDTDPLE